MASASAVLDSNMEGRVVIVTGATNGIGEVTARELARKGATIFGISRSPQRCAESEARIKSAAGHERVVFMAADLSSRADVLRVAAYFRAMHDRLHVLVNNAGALFSRREESADGIEMTWALNHLSYFLLTHELLGILHDTAAKSGKRGRIVNVASEAHRSAKLDFDDLESRKRYRAFTAYGRSKLANIMFTYELARRLKHDALTANVLHPGFVATGFGRSNSGRAMDAGIRIVQRFFAISPEEGALTSIYLASSPAVEGVTGKYFAELRERKSSAQSHDAAAAKRLWDVSARRCGVSG